MTQYYDNLFVLTFYLFKIAFNILTLGSVSVRLVIRLKTYQYLTKYFCFILVQLKTIKLKLSLFRNRFM